MKSVRIRSLSGDYFPAFGMNRRDTPCLRFSAYLVRMRENEDQKIPNTDTFYAVFTWGTNQMSLSNETLDL